MKYILLCYNDEKGWEGMDETARGQAMEEATRLVRDIIEKGQCVGAAPLQPVATASSVRVRDGKRLVTDGPFAETKEQLGGFYLVDVEDVHEAVRIAERHPGARAGTVEIRPVVDFVDPLTDSICVNTSA